MKRLIILLIISIFCGLTSCKKEEKAPLHLELKSLNQLTLAEVRVQKTILIKDPDISFHEIGSQEGIIPDAIEWVKGKTTWGKRIGVYSFGTYFSAYIDLNDLSAEDVVLDKKNKRYSLTLPCIQIKELGRDFEMKTEHERVSYSRSPITPAEKINAKNKASKLLTEELNKNSDLKEELVKKAKQKACSYFELLFSDWGYEVEILFKENVP